MESLTKQIKSKILIKAKKTLKNPKEKRVNRFACYIKVLIDISNTTYCRNNRISVSTILNSFESKYRNSEDREKERSAKYYLEYLLTNKTVVPETLKKYKKWYRKDNNFLLALESIINNACK